MLAKNKNKATLTAVMAEYKTHFRRFELKYKLPSDLSDLIIPALLPYMHWDPFVGESDFYDCHSLYFDNAARKCYQENKDGVSPRKKFRIRTYDRHHKSTDPVFFEMKRKSEAIVLKDRAILPAKFIEAFIDDPFSLGKETTINKDLAEEIMFETLNYHLKPQLLVHYKRKPFFAKGDPDFRVTFDYDLNFASANGASFRETCTPLYEDFVIMEVKFNGSLPRWFYQIIQVHKLEKTSFCKYVEGVELLF